MTSAADGFDPGVRKLSLQKLQVVLPIDDGVRIALNDDDGFRARRVSIDGLVPGDQGVEPRERSTA